MGIVKNTNPKDVLQSIINNFVSSDYTPRDIVTCAKDLALSKYSVNEKVEGKIELSKNVLTLMLDIENIRHLAESGVNSTKQAELVGSVHSSIRIGLTSLFLADEIGIDRNELSDMIREYINDVAKIPDIATVWQFPVTDGKGWLKLLCNDLDDIANLAVIAMITTQEKLICKNGLVPDMDRLFEIKEFEDLFFELLVELNNKENTMAVKNIDQASKVKEGANKNNGNNTPDEIIDAVISETKKTAGKVTVVDDKWTWKDYLLVGVAAGAGCAVGTIAGKYVYDNFLSGDTTLASHN